MYIRVFESFTRSLEPFVLAFFIYLFTHIVALRKKGNINIAAIASYQTRKKQRKREEKKNVESLRSLRFEIC